MNMFDEARAIEGLRGMKKMTQSEIAKMMGTSQSYVANKLRLLKLPSLQRRAILECGLTERHARALLRIREDEKRGEAMAVIIERGLNVAGTEDYIEELLCAEERTKAAARATRYERDLKTRLLTKDMRLFYNSIDRAVVGVRECGFDVSSTRRATDDGTVITIFIKSGE